MSILTQQSIGCILIKSFFYMPVERSDINGEIQQELEENLLDYYWCILWRRIVKSVANSSHKLMLRMIKCD